MGHSFFVGFGGPRMAQALLLTACVFICFQSVPAITCRTCTVEKEGQRCLPPRKTCDMNGGVCMALKVYKGNVMEKKALGCFVDNSKTCGSKVIIAATGEHYEFACCDQDLCSNKL